MLPLPPSGRACGAWSSCWISVLASASRAGLAGGVAGVVGRRLHRLEPRGAALKREAGAVPNCEDARIGGPQMPVHDDAVGDREPRLGGEFHVRPDPGGEQHQVGFPSDADGSGNAGEVTTTDLAAR